MKFQNLIRARNNDKKKVLEMFIIILYLWKGISRIWNI